MGCDVVMSKAEEVIDPSAYRNGRKKCQGIGAKAFLSMLDSMHANPRCGCEHHTNLPHSHRIGNRHHHAFAWISWAWRSPSTAHCLDFYKFSLFSGPAKPLQPGLDLPRHCVHEVNSDYA